MTNVWNLQCDNRKSSWRHGNDRRLLQQLTKGQEYWKKQSPLCTETFAQKNKILCHNRKLHFFLQHFVLKVILSHSRRKFLSSNCCIATVSWPTCCPRLLKTHPEDPHRSTRWMWQNKPLLSDTKRPEQLPEKPAAPHHSDAVRHLCLSESYISNLSLRTAAASLSGLPTCNL